MIIIIIIVVVVVGLAWVRSASNLSTAKKKKKKKKKKTASLLKLGLQENNPAFRDSTVQLRSYKYSQTETGKFLWLLGISPTTTTHTHTETTFYKVPLNKVRRRIMLLAFYFQRLTLKKQSAEGVVVKQMHYVPGSVHTDGERHTNTHTHTHQHTRKCFCCSCCWHHQFSILTS